jgi:hypothetical protein
VDELLVNSSPLLQSSRDLRIAAAEHLDGLLEKIKQTAAHKLATLRKVSDYKIE